MTISTNMLQVWATLSIALAVGACTDVLGLSGYTTEASDAAPRKQCVAHEDCAQSTDDPVLCQQPAGVCVKLKSEDCRTVSGAPLGPDSIVLGSLFSFGGVQARSSTARQNSAILALDEINGQGGIPSADSASPPRSLALVSCDASDNLERAAKHLIDDLHVPAIVGPNASQDTIEISRALSVPRGTLVITPTAFAGSIADLLDNGLTFQMVPTDVQRAPFTRLAIGELESQLKRERGWTHIRLAAVFRDDALGIGTRDSLGGLTLNGLPLADPMNLGRNVRIDAYQLGAPQKQVMIDAYVDFVPDIVVLAGAGELLEDVMLPLEAAWPQANPRPLYLLTDALKAGDLLLVLEGRDDLRQRIRGIGVTPSERSKPVSDSFRVSYEIRHPGTEDSIGMGPSYDAIYAIALALTATNGTPVSGQNISRGLLQLANGGPEIEIEATNLLSAIARLTRREPMTAIGTFDRLAWTSEGAVLGGTLELWCVGAASGKLLYGSSGLTLELETGVLRGEYTQCP